MLAGAVLAVGALRAIDSRSTGSDTAFQAQFRRLTFDRGTLRDGRFTPDGQSIVYGAAWNGDPIQIYSTRAEIPESVPLSLPPANVLAISPAGEMAISLGAQAACPRFAGRVLTGLSRTARTPLWMRELLRRAGVRPLQPIVDVTNYEMLELGQPMHAYDLAKLDGRAEARLARGGEKLTLLDGREVALADDMLVIADARGPVTLHKRWCARAGDCER